MMKSISRNDIRISWQILRDEYYVHLHLMQTVKLKLFLIRFNKVFPKVFIGKPMVFHGFSTFRHLLSHLYPASAEPWHHVPQELEAIALGAALCSLHATEIHIAGAVYQTEHMQIEVLGLSKWVTKKTGLELILH